MKVARICPAAVLCVILVALIGISSTAAPKAPPGKQKSPATKKAVKRPKKVRLGEMSISLTKPSGKLKADVRKWLDAKLNGTPYTILSWGNVVTADIGGQITRKGVELEYEGLPARRNRLPVYDIQKAVLVLDDNGQIVGDEGPAGFLWHNEMLRMGQRHVRRQRRSRK